MNRITELAMIEAKARRDIDSALARAREEIMAMPVGWRKRLRLWLFRWTVKDIYAEIKRLERKGHE